MDLKQLEHFLTVAEERHFTRASRRLHIVQSGLSASIRSLEEELGGPLFLRSTRKVELTTAGAVLLEEARRVLAAARNARIAVTEVHGFARGRLTIGSIHSLAPFVDLPASLGRFRQKFGGIDIELSLNDSEALLDQVREGGLDVAFTQPPDPLPADMARRRLTCEAMAVVCSGRHPLAGARGIALDRLRDETFADLKSDWNIRRLIDRSFAAAGLQRRIGFEVNDIPMLLELVAQGLAVALVPESVAAARIHGASGSLACATIRRADELCWELAAVFRRGKGRQRNEPSSPLTKAFLDLLVLPGGRAGNGRR